MRRIVITAFFIILCFLLQCTVFRYFDFSGIVPNLLIILAASFGFMRGRKTGLIVGFFCGLLMDLFFGSVIGFYSLIMMYIGYTNGLFRRIFYPEDIKLPLILILSSDLVYNLLCYILLFLLRGKFQFYYYFLHVMVPEMVYTITITCILYPILLIVNRKLEAFEKRGAQKFV